VSRGRVNGVETCLVHNNTHFKVGCGLLSKVKLATMRYYPSNKPLTASVADYSNILGKKRGGRRPYEVKPSHYLKTCSVDSILMISKKKKYLTDSVVVVQLPNAINRSPVRLTDLASAAAFAWDFERLI